MKMWTTYLSGVIFFGNIWSLVSNWLGFVTANSGTISAHFGSFNFQDHLALFCMGYFEGKKWVYFSTRRG